MVREIVSVESHPFDFGTVQVSKWSDNTYIVDIHPKHEKVTTIAIDDITIWGED
jgi:hypothetical protein